MKSYGQMEGHALMCCHNRVLTVLLLCAKINEKRCGYTFIVAVSFRVTSVIDVPAIFRKCLGTFMRSTAGLL